jgi:hypothetical protein
MSASDSVPRQNVAGHISRTEGDPRNLLVPGRFQISRVAANLSPHRTYGYPRPLPQPLAKLRQEKPGRGSPGFFFCQSEAPARTVSKGEAYSAPVVGEYGG